MEEAGSANFSKKLQTAEKEQQHQLQQQPE